MNRRAFLVFAGAAAMPFSALGRPARVPVIGALHYSASHAPVIEGLREGLQELGLREGKGFALDVVDGKGDTKAIEHAARRFERERVALIYCVPTSATTVVKRATSEVPIVFCVGSDPVAAGLVDSFARPGGRLTGVSFLTVDLTAKRLELLKDVIPMLRRVLTLYNPDNPSARASARVARDAGRKLGVELMERHVRSVPELHKALAALKTGEGDALFLVADAMLTAQAQAVIDAAKAIRMPTMVYEQTLAERGAMMSYGVDYREIGRQSAAYVQRVLGGMSPADLPVETVTRLAFVLNRGTAREIGVAIAPAMLVRFDRVIE